LEQVKEARKKADLVHRQQIRKHEADYARLTRQQNDRERRRSMFDLESNSDREIRLQSARKLLQRRRSSEHEQEHHLMISSSSQLKQSGVASSHTPAFASSSSSTVPQHNFRHLRRREDDAHEAALSSLPGQSMSNHEITDSVQDLPELITNDGSDETAESLPQPISGAPATSHTGDFFTAAGSPNIKVAHMAPSSPLWSQVMFADASGCNTSDRLPSTKTRVNDKVKIDCLKEYLTNASPDMSIYACASCGVRDIDDKYAQFDISKLGKFRLSAIEETAYFAKLPSIRKYYNIFEYATSAAAIRVELFHLIPDLMSRNSTGNFACYLCSSCNVALKVTGLPDFNVGRIDFGRISSLEPLTDAEELVISKCIRYHKVYKFGMSDQRAFKGHVICFEHDAAIEVSKLPRTNIDELMGITFIGSRMLWSQRTEFGTAREKFIKAYPQIFVDPQKVISRLRLKQKLDPAYENIEIDDSTETMHLLANLHHTLIDAATILENEAAVRIDREVESNVARSTEPADTDSQLEHVLVAEKVVNSASDTGTVLRSLQRAVSLEAENVPSASEPSASAPPSALPAATLNRQGSAAANNVNAHVSTVSMNEFSDNDKYFHGGFPNLFLHGQGLPENSGGIGSSRRRHMLMQYDKRFCNNPSFLFVVFNQLQRHAAARAVSFRVKGSQTSVDRFNTMVNQTGFSDTLSEAIRSPNTTKARKLAKSILNVCRITGGQVPWSSEDRYGAMSKLLSMMQYCGPFSFFVTVSPADMDSPLMLRLADNMGNGMPEIDIPLVLPSLHARHAILCHNSFAAAQVYKKTIETMFACLFHMPIENKTNSTAAPLSERACGILGVTIAYGGVTEAQGRHSAHMHFLMTTDISPMEIARVIDDEEVRKLLSSRIDSVLQAWLPEHFHTSKPAKSEKDCAEDTTEFRDHRHLIDLRKTLETANLESSIEAIQSDGYQAAASSNLHTDHRATCHKGPVGQHRCRMAMPRATWDNGTIFVELDVRDNLKCPIAFTSISQPPQSQSSITDPILQKLDDRVIVLELGRPKDGSDMTQTHVPPSGMYYKNEAVSKNSNVVAFSPTLSAAFRCNTNVETLGNRSQAIAATIYAIKYVVKDISEPANVLALLKGACDHIAAYPSNADDSGTTSRYCKHLIQRVLNTQNGQCEWSQQLVSLALMQMPCNTFSHKFEFCFAWDAVRYVLSHTGTSNTLADPDTAPPLSANANNAGDAEQHLNPQLDEDPENEDEGQAFTVSADSDGQIITVSQVDHYRYRGEIFGDMSLYEYCAIVHVVPKKGAKSAYNFDENHPQSSTHCQQIRRKHCIPQLAGHGPPRHPGSYRNDSQWLEKANKFAQYAITLYVPWKIDTGLPDCLLSYDGLIQWMQVSAADGDTHQSSNERSAATLIHTARMFWIQNLAHGVSVKSKVLRALSIWRARSAQRWGNANQHAASDEEIDASADPNFNDSNVGATLSDEFMNLFDRTCKAIHDCRFPTLMTAKAHLPLTHLGVFDGTCPPVALSQTSFRKDVDNDSIIRNIVNLIKVSDPLPETEPIISSQDSAVGSSQLQRVSLVNEIPDVELGSEQNIALTKVLSWFNRCQMSQSLLPSSSSAYSSNAIKPPLIFISGAAGTGKTHFVRKLYERLGSNWMRCCAFTGNAACNLPAGSTIHSAFGISPTSRSSTKLHSQNSSSAAMISFETTRVLVIDEISLTDATLFLEIDNALRTWKKNSDAFGGLAVIIMGDIFQIDAIGRSLVSAYVDANSIAGSLFRKFKVISFSQQWRASTDAEHAARLEYFRNPGRSLCPVYASKVFDHLQTLSKADLLDDPKWHDATIIVTDNMSRAMINLAQAKRFACRHGLPIIAWYHSLTKPTTHMFDQCAKQMGDDTSVDEVKNRFPELLFYFVAGAPAVIKDNLSVMRGITNGTSCTLKSITLSPQMDINRSSAFWAKVTSAVPGDVIFLDEPPLSVNIELPSTLHGVAQLPSLDTTTATIPMTVTKGGNRLRRLHISKRRGEKTDPCGYYDHSLDLAFALTYHKAQGRTIDRVILVLEDVGHSKLNVASFYVGISRVRKSEHLRIIPVDKKQRSRLEAMKFANDLIVWWKDSVSSSHPPL